MKTFFAIWTNWAGQPGDKSPVDEDELVQVMFAEGADVRTLRAGDLYWCIPPTLPTGIIKYRVYKG